MVIIADQVTKHLAVHSLIKPIEITSFFSLTLTYNRGISFGLFNDHEQQQLTLVVIAIIITLALLLMLILMKNKTKLLLISLSMIISGSIGNIVDRLVCGAVIDFLDFHYSRYYFPIFNLADVSICLGCLFMFYAEYRLQSAKNNF